MANYIFLRNSQLFRNRLLRALWILRRSPNCGFAVSIVCQRDHWLHRRVRQKRNVVVSFIDLSAFGKDSIRVPNAAHYLARIVGSRPQLVLVLIRVVRFVRSVVPRNVQFLAALKCRPGVIGNNRDPAQRLKRWRRLERINRNRLPHARDLQCFFVVVRFHFSAEYRRAVPRSREPALPSRIHAIKPLSRPPCLEGGTYLPLS